MIERYKPVEKIKGAVYALRCLGESAVCGLVRIGDDALDVDFDPGVYRITDYTVEAPVATEEELG